MRAGQDPTTESSGWLARGRPGETGEAFSRSSRRDDVPLRIEAEQGVPQPLGSLGGSSRQRQDLCQIHESVALGVRLVRATDHLRSFQDQRFRLFVSLSLSEYLAEDASPMELGRDVVLGGQLLSDPRERLSF